MRLVEVAGRDWGESVQNFKPHTLFFRSNCPNRHLYPATIFIPPLGFEAGSQMTCRIPKQRPFNVKMKRGHFKFFSRTLGSLGSVLHAARAALHKKVDDRISLG